MTSTASGAAPDRGHSGRLRLAVGLCMVAGAVYTVVSAAGGFTTIALVRLRLHRIGPGHQPGPGRPSAQLPDQ